ncbi:MAG: extensin family protein [Rhodobacteraceae bacterium]|uniref:extensin-like domain-containing protein n=1 Tax=Cypionkella sp. TaxID=2811411 RepID=UPI00132B3208|nr:extensin family protein [Cypionkella sp.]KAF0173043.1 MAG: extensin family protein [Paracoccaceae bacterium]MDO8327867.1 extensin family protein [Cypionkella sp.]
MRRLAPLALIFAALAGSVWAEAPEQSPLPLTRPATQGESVVTEAAPSEAAPAAVVVVQRPRPRPVGLSVPLPKVETAEPETAMLRPRPRPAGLAARAEEVVAVAAEPAPTTKKGKKNKKPRKGSVCGDPDILGEQLKPIGSKTKGCGVAAPVKVTSIAGLPFSQAATFDCDTAIALKNWIENGMRPAFGKREVVQLHIFGSYMCRTRNNQKGAKVSEHGRGRAVDIAGFVFSDGKEWTIARDYNTTIRKAQKAACGIFGTTLGPGSDGYHEDHLHFDIANYGNGPYCR